MPGGYNNPTNYTLNYINGTLTISPLAVTYQANDVVKIYGNLHTFTGAASEATLKVGSLLSVHTLSTTSESSITGAPVAANVGAYPISLTAVVIKDAGNVNVTANYSLTLLTGTLTIDPRPITITANNDTKIYGDVKSYPAGGGAPFVTPSVGGLATSHSITAITLTSTGAPATAVVNTYTISPFTATIRNGGTDVTSNYTITYVNGNLVVGPRPVTFRPKFVQKPYGDTYVYPATNAAIDITAGGLATGQSLTAVSISSPGTVNTAAVITPSLYTSTIASNSAIIKDGGNNDVTANYTVTLVPWQLEVTKVPLTVTAENKGKVYDGTVYGGGYTRVIPYAGLVNGETDATAGITGTLTYGGAAQTAVNAGVYTITMTGLSANNYNVNYASGSLTISRRPVTLTAPTLTKTYGDIYNFAINGSATVATPGELVSGHAITASTVTSTGSPATATVAGSPYATNISGTSVVIKNGATDVTANYDLTLVPGQITIAKRGITLTATTVTKTYGDVVNLATDGSATTLSGTLAPGNSLTSAIVTSDGTPAPATVAGGPYATTISTTGLVINNGATDVTNNYDITRVDGQLTINKRPVTVKANDVTKPYGTNYIFSNTLPEVTVTGALTPVLAPNNAITAFTLSSTGAEATAATAGSPYTISVTANSVVIKDGNGSGVPVTANYDVTLLTGTLSINTPTLEFTPVSVTKVYGDTYSYATDGSATTLSGTLVNGNVIQVQPVVTATNGGATAGAVVAGTYSSSITAGTLKIIDPIHGNADVTANYNIILHPGTFVITKRPITVDALDVTKAYGTLHTFSNTLSEVAVTSTLSPMLAPDNALTVSLASTGTPANAAVAGSPYVINVTSAVIRDGNGAGVPVTANYNVTLLTGTLTITKPTLTFTAKDVTKVYGDTYTFATDGTATSMSGALVNSNTILVHPVVTATNSGANAGTSVGGGYASVITPGTLQIIDPLNLNADVTANYNIVINPGTFVITRRPLTITANNVTKDYGTAHPFTNSLSEVAITSTLSPMLAPNNAVAITLTSAGSPIAASAAGSPYAISVTSAVIKDNNGAGMDVTSNYDITLIEGQLVVNKVPLTIKAEDKSKQYDGLVYTGGYTATYTGFVNGDDETKPGVFSGALNYTGSSQGAKYAGGYVITPQGLLADNYTIIYQNGALVISQRPITLKAFSTTKKYNHTLGFANNATNVSLTAGSYALGDVLAGAVLASAGTPALAAVGTYSIDITVNSSLIKDGVGADMSANYLITLDPGVLMVVPNIDPVANNDSRVTSVDVPVPVLVLSNDSDADGVIDRATVHIVTPPSHGTLNTDPSTGIVIYTPNSGYFGLDNFTYTVKDDDGGTSNIATVSITVLKGPAANDDAATTNPSTPVTLPILDNDITGDAALVPATVAVIKQPDHGAVTIDPATGKAVYTPNDGFFGTDTFTYTVKDANGVISNIATGTIHVNKPPVAKDDNATTNPSTPVVIDIPVNDVRGDGELDPATTTVVKQPDHGTVTIDPSTGKAVYTPAGGFYGNDTFTYTVKDENGVVTNVATVTIHVNQPPTATNDARSTYVDVPVLIDVLNNDVKGDGNLVPASLSIIVQPQHGNLSLDPATGKVLYTPDPGYYGTDNFVYTVKDDNGAVSNQATVTINIPKPPRANNNETVTIVDTPVSIPILGNDEKGDAEIDPATVTVTQQPKHGMVTIDPLNGMAIYTPDPGYFGVDSFYYTVKDQNGAISNVAKTTIAIKKSPVAKDDSAKTTINIPVTIDIPANDTKGSSELDLSSITIIGGPAHGTLSMDPETGKVVYKPNPDYYGSDDFTYTIKGSDGVVSNIAKVTITINKPPVATNDRSATDAETPIKISIMDNDLAFNTMLDPATVVIIGQPAYGTVTINADGIVTYTPSDGFEGEDVFTYSVKDKNGLVSNIATVTINVANKKPDLNVTKKLVTAASLVKVGSEITYSIEVANMSNTPATEVVVTDPLPVNLGGSTVTMTVTVGTVTYNGTTKTISWTIPTLAGGEKQEMLLKVKVISGGNILNTANVRSNEVDGNPANNTSQASYQEAPDVQDDFFVPNVITPNGDGKNDKFIILGLNRYPNSGLIIYNRWGNMVYHSNNYSNDWDGSGLNEGTYYYVLTVNKPGAPKKLAGWIQLIRR